ncbi:hypothetical protein [Nitrospira sp. Ecomares 2.1]
MLGESRWLGHQMRVLMMSGGSDERVLRKLFREGAQGCILKPFHLISRKQVCREIITKMEIEEQVPHYFHVA